MLLLRGRSEQGKDWIEKLPVDCMYMPVWEVLWTVSILDCFGHCFSAVQQMLSASRMYFFFTFSKKYFSIFVQDERNQILTAYLWIRQSWYDAYLKWDKDKYDGLDSIRIPSNLVWRPDIVLYNKWVRPERIILNGHRGRGRRRNDSWSLNFILP